MSVVCSCGVEGCRELGWPHEWDPIAAGDDCAASGVGESPHHSATVIIVTIGSTTHKVQAPFVRYGCGYACTACVDA